MGSVGFIDREGLGRLVERLGRLGYVVIAPVRRGEVIVYDQITSAEQIARGVRDEQEGGRYRLVEGEASLLFEYVVPADGAKRYLFPPEQSLLSLHVEEGRFVIDEAGPSVRKIALLGIRPCELAAIRVQDKVFGLEDTRAMRCESEAFYAQTRQQAITIVVNCCRPGGTCFCVSMGTGPEAQDGFDLSLTELREGFIVKVGSPKGQEVVDGIGVREATGSELELAELKLARAREHMGRQLATEGLRELLDAAVESPQWDEVAGRCLSCGNCTMVCPTCFCSTVQDWTDLSGRQAMRKRQWESCFTHEFSYLTAGPVRHTIRGRYRHWLRHKLGTWHEQFGCSGCVGCGRCITWCPVGIDLTQEVAALRSRASARPVQAGNLARSMP